MIDKKELQEIGESSYTKWFERYYRNANIESWIKESAQKGYKGVEIDCKVDDEYTKHRMRDDRFEKMLRIKLPDLDINRKTGCTEYQLLGIDMKKWYDEVSISWD